MQLVEFLAENAHDIWAENKINGGWSYGKVRDEDKKHHPNLVPYSELVEVDREFDRNAACDVLLSLIKSGFKVRREESAVEVRTHRTSVFG